MRRCAVMVGVALLATAAMGQERHGKPPFDPNAKPAPMPPLVEKALNSYDELRFSGTRTVELRYGGERKRHIEIVIKDGLKTRIEFPADSPQAGQVIVEDGANRKQYFPQTNEIHVSPARKDEAITRMRKFATSAFTSEMRWDVRAGGDVAGIETDVATLADRQGNPVLRLWIDPRTGMMLRREMYDRVGTLIGFFEYSQVNQRPKIGPYDFSIKRRGAKIVTREMELQSLCKENGFLPLRLPETEGYRLDFVRVLKEIPEGALLQAYVSDKGRLTLFQMRTNIDESRFRSMVREGSQYFRWQVDGRTFVLIGEASKADLERLASKLTDR